MLVSIIKVALLSLGLLIVIKLWGFFCSYLQFKRWRDTGIVFMGNNTFNPLRDAKKIIKSKEDYPTAGISWV